jgi:outer membrane receptor protein involved in Fe transport
LPSIDPAVTEASRYKLDKNRTTYRIGTTWQAAEDILVHAAWSTGYKPGGFDGSRDTSAFNQGRVYGYETSENFEVGVSAELLQGALLANATIFRTDISGHQSRVNFGTMDAIGNRASIQQQGIEADLNWRPMEQLTVSVAGAWLDSTYSDFQGAPDWPGLNTPAGTNLTGNVHSTHPTFRSTVSCAGTMCFRGFPAGHGRRWPARIMSAPACCRVMEATIRCSTNLPT